MQRIRFAKLKPMKLTIHNFAKIESAELKLDGMTVICGDNNTGKSTVGKVLATIFKAFADQERSIYDLRQDKYISIILNSSRNHRLSLNKLAQKRIMERIMDASLSDDDLISLLKEFLPENGNSENLISTVKQINEVRTIPDSELNRQIVFNCFDDVFLMQYFPLGRKKVDNTELILDYQGNRFSIKFQQDADLLPLVDNEIDIRQQAFFIDSADVLDYINEGNLSRSTGDLNHLVIKAINSKIGRERSNENAIDDYLVNAKIKDIYEKLTTTLDGDFVLESGKVFFHEDNMPANLEITNLSKGMKAFALLQLLLKEHVLQQEDVLILDEPEIHLHPAWQVLYAEILVLLQKSFNLTVLLTTHSSYFLEAIQLFCRKYHQENILHVYQSTLQQEGEMAVVAEVDSRKASSIYSSFLEPLNALQSLRDELKEAERDE